MPKLTSDQAQSVEEAESREFELLDIGTYLGALNAVTEEPGKEFTYWVWEFVLVGDAEGNDLENTAKLWENTSLSPKAAFRLKAMFEAFEVPADTDTDELLGRYVWIDVGQEVQKEGKNQGKLRNVFLSASPASDE